MKNSLKALKPMKYFSNKNQKNLLQNLAKFSNHKRLQDLQIKDPTSVGQFRWEKMFLAFQVPTVPTPGNGKFKGQTTFK